MQMRKSADNNEQSDLKSITGTNAQVIEMRGALMYSQYKTTQQIKGTKFFEILGKLFVVGLILAIVLLLPLPFIRPMWGANIQRWRMYETVSRRVIGMSQVEVQEMLGAPQNIGYRNGMVFSYPLNTPVQRWRHIIISFNEYGKVERVRSGNPLHNSALFP